MSTITATLAKASEVPTNDVWIATWASMGDADTGTAVAMSGASDRSVHFTGTFASATVVLQGSNDGTNWITLADPQGNVISKTSAAIEAVLELTRYVRAVTSGGSGAAITVYLLMKGQRG